MSTAAVIVSWNGSTFVESCLDALLDQDPRPWVLVVDNGSTDGTVDVICQYTARDPQVELIENDRNLGFTRGANLGMKTLQESDRRPTSILLVNQDATLHPGALAAATAVLDEDEDVGAVGFKILYPDEQTIQHAGGVVTEPRLLGLHIGHHQPASSGQFDRRREVDYVTGAVMLLRSSALEEVGLFDDIFSPGFYEDVELCSRLRARGWKVVYAPEAVASHQESSSFSDRRQRWVLSHRNRLLFAVARLADPSFRADFAAAEEGHVTGGAQPEELQILAQAYFHALLRLDRAGRQTASETVEDPAPVGEIRDVFAALRNRCLEELHRQLSPRQHNPTPQT